MRVFGIDFTSAPNRAKPISCAIACMVDDRLTLHGLCEFEALESFSNFLRSEGPWIAGLDFPFGLPRGFLEPANMSNEWSAYVAQAAAMERSTFRALARSIAADGEPGEKYLKRQVDALAGAQSPMNVVRPPVGLMFHAGAPALLDCDASVLPVRPRDNHRLVIEAYPKLVAHSLIGRTSYKDDPPHDSGGARQRARSQLVHALANGGLNQHYQLSLDGVSELEHEFVADTHGDKIDAVMCAVQAAWAWLHRDQGYGLPDHADSVEGWIADPVTRDANAMALGT